MSRPASSPASRTRREFLGVAGAGLAAASTGCATARARTVPVAAARTRPTTISNDRFDPWIELDRSAFHNNVKEASRLADGRPILAVVKNNGYGLGDRVIGPMMDGFDEVGGMACVRPEEAIAMRDEGVTKPIVVMAEAPEDAIAEMVERDVLPSVWLDDAPERLERVSRRLGRPVPVQLFIDSGMNREGMPVSRARPWIEALFESPYVEVDGTYTMFSHDLDFNRDQLAQFEALRDWARGQRLDLGTIHAAPTVELFHFPQGHYDMVRPGNALFGHYPSGDGVEDQADLRPVLRLRTRVVRVEHLEPGDAAGFYRRYEPEEATWVALLPIGSTDGYPYSANDTCEVLINGRLYPIRGGVNSAHAIVDLGPEKTVSPGDVATLIGPEDPAILPAEVGRRTEFGSLALIQGMNPRLPRVFV